MKTFESFSKEKRFQDFSRTVQYCSLCYRLSNRTKVLTNANGNINSKVLFIAEAPGRLGADRTGIPLFGDRTGEIFGSLINNIGWEREQIFITNAVLCNPRQENGNNGTPTKEEISNCSLYLRMTIELIQPEVIAPLGKTALEALALIYPHSITLKDAVAKLILWNGRYLFPLYHPSPRALIHRSLIKQRSDYMLLSKKVAPLKGLKVKKDKKFKPFFDQIIDNRTPLHELILIFIKHFRAISMFKLMKLLYLTDIMSLKKYGRTLSGEIYLRQQEGPWIPKFKDTLNSMKGHNIEIYFRRKIPFITLGPNYNFNTSFDENSLSIIAESIEKFGEMSEAKIKTVAYLTEPMKYILRQEKSGRNMYNTPVLYKDMTSIEIDTS